jgi:hypothetical protein
MVGLDVGQDSDRGDAAPRKVGAVGAPIPARRAGCPVRGTGNRWFPCSLWSAQRIRSPAVPRRPRHAYAAGFQRGLPGRRFEDLPEVPAACRNSGTHRARPISARFEPVSKSRA